MIRTLGSTFRGYRRDPMRAYFNSDNYAPVLPEVMDALATVNAGHEPAYGYDSVTMMQETKTTLCQVAKKA